MLKLITLPGTEPPGQTEPVSLAQFKASCRINLADTAQDVFLWSLLKSAREWCEENTGLSFIDTTWEETFQDFYQHWYGDINFNFTQPNYYWRQGNCQRFLSLTRNPVKSITSITYQDKDNLPVVLAGSEYKLYASERVGSYLLPTTAWPGTFAAIDAITIRYVAGFTFLPERVVRAILLLAGSWYQSREAFADKDAKEIGVGLERLLSQLRDVRTVGCN